MPRCKASRESQWNRYKFGCPMGISPMGLSAWFLWKLFIYYQSQANMKMPNPVMDTVSRLLAGELMLTELGFACDTCWMSCSSVPVIAGKLKCDVPKPAKSDETHTQHKQLWRFCLQRLCSKWSQSPFTVNFTAIQSGCFLQGLWEDLPHTGLRLAAPQDVHWELPSRCLPSVSTSPGL